MRCANGHDNPPGKHFCGECGSPLDDAGASNSDPLQPGATNDGAQKSTRKKWPIGVVALALAGLLLGALALLNGDGEEASNAESGADTADGESDAETEIELAAEACGLEGRVGDDGTSITLDTQGADDAAGDDYADAACLLNGLDTPDRVISRMDQTRAMDGTLDAQWGDYEAFWNYHPDNGMNLTVYEAE